jgi:hypothetical protein
LQGVSIGNRRVEIVRLKLPYRRAVWCGRFGTVFVATSFILGFLDAPTLVQFLMAAGLAVFWIAMLALLHRAGVPVEFYATRHGWIAEREVRRQFYRDLFWLPPR